LEERALLLADLATCLPDDQDWLWRAEGRLRSEAEGGATTPEVR